MSAATTTFDAVAGHAANMFYGNKTDDGRTTLQKPTTAWEIIYYIAMTWGTEVEAYVNSLTTLSDAEKTETMGFVKAVQGLKAFAPLFFSARLPAAPWEPATAEVRAALAPLGGADKLRDIWLEIRNPDTKSLWSPLFVELFVGTIPLDSFSEAFDQPIWGIGLVDETSRMTEPAAMDVKVGYCRHSPFTPEDKVQRMNRKEGKSLTGQVALRVCGLRRFLHDATPHEKESFGKAAGYAFATPQELAAGMRDFFSTQGPLLVSAEGDKVDAANATSLAVADRSNIKDAAAVERQRAALAAMNDIVHFFEATPEGQYLMEHMAIVSASLLFLYDAEGNSDSVVVRLIDFARSSHRRLNFDEATLGFVQGLRNVCAYLSEE